MAHTPIAIVRMAVSGAMGPDLRSIVQRIRGESSGVRRGLALEQAPARPADVGETPLPIPVACVPNRAEILLERCLSQLLSDDPSRALSAPPERCAFVIGTTLAGMRHCGTAMRRLMDGDQAAANAAFRSMPAGQVLRKVLAGYPIRGCSTSISCACASALSAVANGCAMLQSGDADAVVAGGYDPIAEFSFAGFSALQLVATGPLSPFAAEREGMKLGEGAALFLLRRLDDARELGESILGIVDGIGEASDAFHLTRPHPEGRGAAAALSSACGDGQVDLIIAHATGTPDNDGCEYAAYRSTFGSRLRHIPVTALKSRFGHPLGAAGALELAVALQCATEGFIPAGVGNPPNAEEFPELDLVHRTARSASPQRMVALSAGFGGANVAIAVRRPASREVGVTAGRPALAVGVRVSAIGAVSGGGRGVAGLEAMLGTLGSDVTDDLVDSMVDRARTRRLALLPKLLICAVRDLLESVQLSESALSDVPTLVATWHGATGFTERYYTDLIGSGIDLANPMLFAESVPNVGSAHVSITYGVRAPSASVIGTRTSGLEALHLARARISAGIWRHALVLAAEESHPLVDSVLSDVCGATVHGRAGAVALLLQRDEGQSGVQVLSTGVGEVAAGASVINSGQVLDEPLQTDGGQQLMLPEMGSCTGLALLALAADRSRHDRVAVCSRDPKGIRWWAELGPDAPSL